MAAMAAADAIRAAERFASGVVMICVRDAAGRPQALRAKAFNSVSLAPPIVMWVLQQTPLLDIETGRACGISVLTEQQAARLEQAGGNPSGLHWQPGEELGAPQVTGAVACFEAVVFKRIVYDDHAVHFAQLASFGSHSLAAGALSYSGQLYAPG